VPSHVIAAADEWGEFMLGDKARSSTFDTTKPKSVVPEFVATIPFEQRARAQSDHALICRMTSSIVSMTEMVVARG